MLFNSIDTDAKDLFLKKACCRHGRVPELLTADSLRDESDRQVHRQYIDIETILMIICICVLFVYLWYYRDNIWLYVCMYIICEYIYIYKYIERERSMEICYISTHTQNMFTAWYRSLQLVTGETFMEVMEGTGNLNTLSLRIALFWSFKML